MKRFLFLSLLALFGAAFVRGDVTRADLVDRVASCEAVLQGFQNGPGRIPREVFQRAKAIIIVNQFKGAFLLGVKDGYGVILVRRGDGHWSLPVLIHAGEASFGLQLGANSVETVYIITDDQTPRMLFKQRFNVGVDAKAVAGPKSDEKEKLNEQILATPMLVYTKSIGLYAGATVKAGYLTRNDPANFLLYDTKYTMPELLYSDWVKPPADVQPIINLVQGLAP
jgi:SH3 domain-containing YSC84-like protein 1